MLKIVLAGTTALAIAGGTLAYAQQGPAKADTPRWRASAEDVTALGDARIAGLKAGLKLTPEQEKNWPAVEAALRDLFKQRADRVAARAGANAGQSTDPVERMSRRAEAMQNQGAALKKLADAAGPLYKSLDEGQKRRFVMLAKVSGRDGWQGRHGHGDRHGWRHGPRGDGRGPQGPGGGPQRL